MKYRRMPIEIESPEEIGYERIRCNLTESSVPDLDLSELGGDLGQLKLAYTDHLGKPALRQIIASDGPGLSESDVVVTAGAAAALFIVATSLLDERCHVVVIHPNYATNIETPRSIGCDVDFLRLSFEDRFSFDVDRLAGLIRPTTKLISVTTPHNPTGTTLTEKDLHRLAALAESRGCYLLVDETYREMNFAGPTPLAATISPRCISVASLSKSFGMPGVRVGWIVTRDTELRRVFLAAKEQIFICNSVVDEEIAFRALARKTELLPPILERNRRAFETVRAWITDRADLEWVEPSGGVVCFPRMIARDETRVDAFYRILTGKYGTFVGPGHWFEMGRHFMRIGYAWPSAPELAEGLQSIALALGETNG